MKMRDKLVKYNRKAPYYVMKKCAISFSVLVACAVTVAVPVTLKVGLNTTEAPHAENKEDYSSSETYENEDLTSEKDAEEELLEY